MKTLARLFETVAIVVFLLVAAACVVWLWPKPKPGNEIHGVDVEAPRPPGMYIIGSSNLVADANGVRWTGFYYIIQTNSFEMGLRADGVIIWREYKWAEEK